MTEQPTILRSARRKRSVALHVQPDGTLCVQAPMRTSVAWINRFIESKAAWIARRRARVQEKASRPTPVVEDGAFVSYQGQLRRVRLVEEGATVEGGEADVILFSLPAGLSDEGRRVEAQTELTLWYKRQARRVFAERLALWAERLSLRPARLIVTAPLRQWGSCSATNDIRLNWRLIMAAPELLDYVIVHELCHIPHKHHGKAFWRSVEAAMPDAKALRRTLRAWEAQRTGED
ncbi:MAG: SprT family zinc-dependent metalloprotease [Bdellovibrionales bacterium]|jgi:hypothetical protein